MFFKFVGDIKFDVACSQVLESQQGTMFEDFLEDEPRSTR
jgi:hypothetical protein